MAITFFGVATTPADNSTQADNATVVVTEPASMVAGDLCVLIGTAGIATAAGITLSQQGGQTWDALAEHTATAAATQKIWWCKFNGTMSAHPSLAFTNYAGSIPCSVQLLVFRPTSGTDTWAVDTAIAYTDFTAPGSPFTMTVTGITPTAAETVSIAGWVATGTAITLSSLSGTGWSQTSLNAQYRDTSGSDITVGYAYNIKSSSSPTNNVSLNGSAGLPGTKFIIAFSDTAVVFNPGFAVGATKTTGGIF
jgi:hypothetical protein